MAAPPDWQLPRGVNRGLWDYLHDADVARGYDQSLAGTPLLTTDVRFAEEYFDRPGKLIDLGCGTGRLLLPFARQGFWVLGVDLSEEMLRVAGEKARATGVTVHRLKANVVELSGLAGLSFDYATCLFSTLGMVMGLAERRQVVNHVYRLLRPGGRFVLHVHNRWFNFWDRAGRAWLARDVVRSILGSKTAGDRVMPVHQGVAGLTLHLFTRREAVALLRSAGFRIVEARPVGLGANGRVAAAWWFGAIRAYGYLIAAERPVA
jgi:ubiquinone/menaquinone biosynthesis C-methylase UbiE